MKGFEDSGTIKAVEQRRQARYRKGTEIQLCDQGNVSHRAQLHDMSVGGFCFDTQAPLEPGQRVQFFIDVPGKGNVSGMAQIRWRHPLGLKQGSVCGAKIETIGMSDASKLHRYLEPHSFDLLWSVDLVIKGGCVIITFLVLRDLLRDDVFLYQSLSGKISSMLEYLPQLFLSAAACLGIFVLFKRGL